MALEHDSAAKRLEAWRAAQRELEAAAPGSAREALARNVADRARDLFHECEDAVRASLGDARLRSDVAPGCSERAEDAESG